ncbi:MAG: ATP-binding protein [Thermodesulfobacteriota bacterium]
MDERVVKSILESMSDSLIVVAEDGAVLYTNRATERILGCSWEDLKTRGLALVFFVREENYDFNQIFVDAVWNKSMRDYCEVDYHHPDGSVRRLAATTSYLLADEDRQSSFMGFISLFRDITDTYTLRRKELALINERERIANENIRGLQRLAMGVAHEIRNPMVTIGGFAARIGKDASNSEKTLKYAQSILEDARKLELLVQRIQEYCNLPPTKLKKGDLSVMLKSVISKLAAKARERSVDVQLHDCTGDRYETRFDPMLLKKAMLNLVENAIDFSLDGAKVEVSVFRGEEDLVIEVKDAGEGIRREDLDFIFNPFFSTRPSAAGMGLAVVERVVHEHMGRITVASQRGEGTTFRISIPSFLSD